MATLVTASATTQRPEDLNPLLIKWLTDWKQAAKNSGSKMEFVYGKALKSIRAHTESLSSGAQCKKLKGFGDKLCAQIDKKFSEHYGPGYILTDNSDQGKQLDKNQATDITNVFSVRKRMINTPTKAVPSPVRKVSRTQRYIPAQGSSGFAILVSLLRYELEYSMTKVNKLDLQDMASRYTTTLASSTNKAARYSGWNTMKTLLSRGLVERTEGRASYYYLTEDGRKLARTLAIVCPSLQDFVSKYIKNNETNQNENNENFDVNNENIDTTDTRHTENIGVQSFIFEKGSYEIILCIDSRERISTNFCKENRAAFATALQKQDIHVEIRTLPLGDFVWVAREKAKTQPGDIVRFNSVQSNSTSKDVRKELVLDLIVERKRIDDLASSIKDNRWNEQKFRLRNCGIRKPTYLIEYAGKGSKRMEYGGIKPDALEQAITNAELDGFDVKRTENFEETVRYLTFMTRWLERFYACKAIMSCPNKESLAKTVANDFHYITFNEFAVNSSKIQTFTNKEMFVKHLLQIKGLSLAKVNSIIEKYPTFTSLQAAYASKTDLYSKHNLLTDLKSNSIIGPTRRLGPTLSKKICEYYTR